MPGARELCHYRTHWEEDGKRSKCVSVYWENVSTAMMDWLFGGVCVCVCVLGGTWCDTPGVGRTPFGLGVDVGIGFH